ncbi:MAG TPA: heavy-metal-associated domain-containing protein [Armatimonadota bacterium]|jgi:PleD family two-component response regulator|nr:heavy-metal-associated domain-containing protein [Armatimonadota bacterium]
MAYRVAVFPLEDEARADQAPTALESALQDIPGIRDAAIDPLGQTVRIIYDDDRTNLLDVRRILAQHGFPVSTPITSEGQL